MRVICVGDLHLADHPPSSCTETYTDDLFDLLDQVTKLSRQLTAEVVLVGDIFHHKAPSRTSHGLVRRFMRWCASLPREPWIVVGNHDVQHDRLDTLDRQPLGTVFEARAAYRGQEAIVHMDGHLLDFVPWQDDWEAWLDGPEVEEKTKGLTVAHAPLYPPGRELPWENIDARRFAARVRTDHVYYGHVHENHDTWELDDVTFANVGALSRGSLAEHDVHRKIRVMLYGNDHFRALNLIHKPAAEALKVAEARSAAAAAKDLDQFSASVGQTQVQYISMEQIVELLRARTDVSSSVRRQAINLLEEVE